MNEQRDEDARRATRAQVGHAAVALAGPTSVLLIALFLITTFFPGIVAPLHGIVPHDSASLHARRLLIARAETMAPGAPPVNNLWAIRADGSEMRRVTNETQGVLDYAVSPDGTRIVFVTTDDAPGTALWLIDTDGTGRTRLSPTTDHARYLSPTWSPAGDAILYVRYDLVTPTHRDAPSPGNTVNPVASETGKIWAISPEGGVIGRVYGNGDEAGQAPIWAPDASHAALLEVFPQNDTSNLVITDFGGRPLKFPVSLALHLSWSPDSQWLAFDELTPGNTALSHIVLLRVDGGARQPLFPDATHWDSAPVWSPDGETLAFIRRHDPIPAGAVGHPDEVWRATRDGRQPRRLFGGPDLASSDLAWSPDGQMLATTRFRVIGTTQRGVWMVNADGTNAHLLLDNAERPIWLP